MSPSTLLLSRLSLPKLILVSGFLIAFFMGGLSYLALCYATTLPQIVPEAYRDDFKPTWEALGKTHGLVPKRAWL